MVYVIGVLYMFHVIDLDKITNTTATLPEKLQQQQKTHFNLLAIRWFSSFKRLIKVIYEGNKSLNIHNVFETHGVYVCAKASK